MKKLSLIILSSLIINTTYSQSDFLKDYKNKRYAISKWFLQDNATFNYGEVWYLDTMIIVSHDTLYNFHSNKNQKIEINSIHINYRNSIHCLGIITTNVLKGYETIFGKIITMAIFKNKVITGMSKNQVRLSWGDPTNINKTILDNLVSEQWIYEDEGRYLYFKNGKLNAIQEYN